MQGLLADMETAAVYPSGDSGKPWNYPTNITVNKFRYGYEGNSDLFFIFFFFFIFQESVKQIQDAREKKTCMAKRCFLRSGRKEKREDRCLGSTGDR